MFKIEKGIEFNKHERYGKHQYPIKDMEPGDSFFVQINGTKHLRNVRVSLCQKAKLLGVKLATKTALEGDYMGIRVWRTA